jgi:hypothetical protein
VTNVTNTLSDMLRSDKKQSWLLMWLRCALIASLTSAWTWQRQNRCERVLKPAKNSTRSKILSYSLYGDDTRYIQGAIENAQLYKHVYPGWGMRVYYDSSVPKTVLQTLRAHGVELLNFTGSKLSKMTWRFLPLSELNVDIFCSRDIDSRLSLRERVAVYDWLSSGRKFHIMRDHPSHSSFAMSGGMWCAKSQAVPNMKSLLEQAMLSNDYLEDMDFLNNKIWPLASKDVLQHDSFSCDKFGAKPFPIPRVGLEHVGSVYIDGEMRQKDVELLKASVLSDSHQYTPCNLFTDIS